MAFGMGPKFILKFDQEKSLSPSRIFLILACLGGHFVYTAILCIKLRGHATRFKLLPIKTLGLLYSNEEPKQDL